MSDIARSAGVGVATVDRVLNGRATVRPETADRVLEAALQLGYHARGVIAARAGMTRPLCRLGFILQKQSKAFYRHLAHALEVAGQSCTEARIDTRIDYVEALSPKDLSNSIADMSHKVDAIGLVSIDHPRVSSAIDAVSQAKCPVFAMLSPLSATRVAGYIGIDGRRAGRTAGWLMHRHVSRGDVGILVGSHRYLGHEALEVGFRSYLREHAPEVKIQESLVYLDDAAVACEAASELLRRSPDLVGLYQCGGGVKGVLQALEDDGRAGEIAYVCHEVNAASEAALLDGTIAAAIATPVDAVAVATVSAMVRAILGKPLPRPPALNFAIVTPENI